MLTLVYIGHNTPPALPGVEWHTTNSLIGLIERVVRLQPSLIVLSLPDTAWQPIASALKSSNATRRIHILLIGDDKTDVQLFGADSRVSSASWATSPQVYVAQYARADDVQAQANLRDQCAEPLPPRGIEAVERFNSGLYYDQHDLFEAQWMQETRPVRSLYQAVLQVGIGYYHVTRGNYRGALKTLQKSVQWLALLPDTCQGIDVRQLREDSTAVRDALERLGSDRLHEFDLALLKPLRLVAPEG